MPIALAALLLLFLQSPAQSQQKPSPPRRSSDDRFSSMVARICDPAVRDHGPDIAAMQKTGLEGVRWLVRKAAIGDPEQLPWLNILTWFQPKAPHIGEDLLLQLQDPDDRAHIWWGVALANVTPPVVDLLTREFTSDDHARRRAAVRAARCFVEHYEAVAPKLAPLTGDADADVRYWATFSLGGLTPASLPALFDALESKDARVRAAAAEGIQKSIYPSWTEKESAEWGGYSTWHGLPPGMELRELSNTIVTRDGIDPLRAALNDANEDVRFFAAMALFELGSKAIGARPELEAALADPSPGVRLWAKYALARTDPTPWIRLKRLASVLTKKDSPPAPLDAAELAQLTADLDHEPEWTPNRTDEGFERWSPRPDVRFEAVRAITTRGLDVLLTRAASEDAKEVEAATLTLTALERELDHRISKLIRILDSLFGGAGPEAGALVELGPLAVPSLEQVLLRYPRFPIGCPTYYVVAQILAQIGEPALPAAAIGLAHWHYSGRIFSTQILLAGGEKSAPLAPSVVSAWRSVGPDVRVPGTDTRWDTRGERLCTGYSGPANTRGVKLLGTNALPVLVRALDDPHGVVRMRAATSLGSFGKEGAPALEALVRRLADDQRYVAEAAADAILLIAPSESQEAAAARARLNEPRAK